MERSGKRSQSIPGSLIGKIRYKLNRDFGLLFEKIRYISKLRKNFLKRHVSKIADSFEKSKLEHLLLLHYYLYTFCTLLHATILRAKNAIRTPQIGVISFDALFFHSFFHSFFRELLNYSGSYAYFFLLLNF